MVDTEGYEPLKLKSENPPEEKAQKRETESELEENSVQNNEPCQHNESPQLREFQSSVEVQMEDEQLGAVNNKDQHERGLEMNTTAESAKEAAYKEHVNASGFEGLATLPPRDGEAENENQLSPSLNQISKPVSVTDFVSFVPTQDERRSPQEEQKTSLETETVYKGPTMRIPSSDGYNWRKYGQKQVKIPLGSRSYYKCTHSNCCAKKIQFSDHSGCVTDISHKGMHCHDPPRKKKSVGESSFTSSLEPAIGSGVMGKQPTHKTRAIAESERQGSSELDGDNEVEFKENLISESELKKRVKKGDSACSDSVSKPEKKTKFVVHVAGDVGISGDGYRWRKYGQKMVKGKPNPRNYYRCTCVGCPARKHIEMSVENSSAVTITYKGVHDHDMPVPKKQQCAPSTPLVAAAAPASVKKLKPRRDDVVNNQITARHYSVGTQSEMNCQAFDVGGDRAIESARTLLSIGFEIKPC